MEKYKNKGLTGLANLGNTCFINSCLQILSHTYELNDFLNNRDYKKRLNNKYESALLLEWDTLREMMWKQNCTISPGKFIKTIQKLARIKDINIFTGFAQNDLPEFLLFVVNSFHIALQREVNMKITGQEENDKDKLATECFQMIKKMYTKEYSEIWNLFYGVHISQLKSVNTDEVLSRTPEPFFMLDLPIPQNNKSPTLLDCLDLYVKGERLSGSNAWFNEKSNKKEDVNKEILFWSLPSILVIDLKRFNAHGIKNQILVDYPLTDLDLSNYVIGYKKDSYKYDLYAVANHTGSTLGGHYYAYVKNANNKWYNFNDTNVSEINNIENVITGKTYCLFYRKKD